VILREYLYVDTTKVRGIVAQLDAGVVESSTTTSSKDKKSTAGFKGFVEHSQNWTDNETATKAMADALFPQLEEALEAEGLLEDVSDFISSEESWADGIEDTLPAGKIVRLTSPGFLIDARFIADILSGFAVANRGLVNMGILGQEDERPKVPPKARGPKPKAYRELPGEADSLEGRIPLGKIFLGPGEADQISGELFRGIAQVTRGMFAPGLHLSLTPEPEGAGAISVRLQEGRQYLDMDPDILFAHYGVGAQEWTIVGTIGHHPLPNPDMDESDFISEDGGVRRSDFGRYVTKLGTMLANLGFVDLPQAPGFSIIPWAVYRTIGTPSGPQADGDAAASP
jgi:hypothetical protein